jgi:uncharacterized membrane protein YcaP (DUF421 family)
MTLLDIFGETNHIEWWQEVPRAFVVFIFGLILLRLSGRRAFARWSALDIIVSIMMGSSLSRALTGSAPLGGTMLAMILLAFMHWLLARTAARYKGFAQVIEGMPAILGQAGAVFERQLLRHNISDTDMQEALRKEGVADAAKTRQITLEPSGTITVLTA